MPAPLQSNGDHSLQQTAEHSTAPAQEQQAGKAGPVAAQPPALLSDSIQEQAASQANSAAQGRCQEAATLAVPSAEQGRPRVSSLQPKALPSLSFGSKKSSSLFRQAPKSSPALPATQVPAHATPSSTQQSPASATVAAAASAEEASADKSLSQAHAGTAMTEAAGAVELDHTLASDPAVTMALDVSEDTIVEPREALAGPGKQSLPIQSQPTKLGSMFGASKRAKLGPGAAMLSVLPHSKQPARTTDQVGFAHLCAIHGSSLG